jgi:hypothetical protein
VIGCNGPMTLGALGLFSHDVGDTEEPVTG